jgi:hypothetical protein
MTVALDMAQARANLANAALAVAETQLHAFMLEKHPQFTGTVAEGVTMRRFEAIAEDHRNGPFCAAWSAYMRARRIERRARSALLVAQLNAAQPRPFPEPRRRRVRRSIGAGIAYEVAA